MNIKIIIDDNDIVSYFNTLKIFSLVLNTIGLIYNIKFCKNGVMYIFQNYYSRNLALEIFEILVK